MAAVAKTTVSGLNPVTANLVTFSVSDTFVARRDATYLFVLIKGAGSTENVTLDDPTSVAPDGATAFNPDAVMSVPVSSTKSFWVRNIGRFMNPSTGVVTVTSSGVTLTGYIFELV